ncbi:TonB-dependent receptor [Campylobacter sputorum]|uniref:TonB-dependent receptor n=1 Tax=Campylobacter sputorum TaxID=206 RepID=UPI00068BF5F5|nr:TonB-dependent receptor [Campylobacter sputorum]
MKNLTLLLSLAVISQLYADTITLNTVKVTAQKMEENINDIPQSITVLDDVDIEEKRIDNIKKLYRFIPNTHTHSAAGINMINFRGINHSIFTNSNPITFYINGVPQTNFYGYEAHFQDVDRIEILRGPQGTLYGKESIGGTINIITKEPDNEWSGDIGTEFAQDNTYTNSLNLGGALVDDKLFLTLGGYFYKTDGWLKNNYNDSNALNDKVYKLNSSLVYKPNERFNMNLSFFKDNQDASGYIPTIKKSPILTRKQAKKETSFDVDSFQKIDTYSSSLNLEYEFDDIKVGSLSTYKNTDIYAEFDADYSNGVNKFGTNLDKVIQYRDIEIDTFSQEIKLSSLNQDKFRWVAGLYYESENTNNKSLRYPLAHESPIKEMDSPAKGKAKTYAIFGQGSYDILNDLTLILGSRLQRIEKDMHSKAFSYPLHSNKGTLLYELNTDESYNKFLPKIALNYKINDDFNIYAGYSFGYLPGGINYFATSPAIGGHKFKPQTSDNYEVGFRGFFLDNSLMLGVNLFYMDIDDIHVYNEVIPGTWVVGNANKATSKGIEIEAIYDINKNFKIDTNFGLVSAKYGDQKDVTTGKNIKDNKIERTPAYTLNVGLSYNHNSGFYSRLDIYSQGKTYLNAANDKKQNPWVGADLRVGYMSGSFDIYAFVENIGNEEHINDITNGWIGSMVDFNKPRVFGVGARYHF